MCVCVWCVISVTVRPKIDGGRRHLWATANSPSCLSVDEEARFLAPLSASSRSELRRESEAPATFDIDVDLKYIEINLRLESVRNVAGKFD